MISDPRIGLESGAMRRLFALAVTLLSVTAGAAPFAVQVGEARLALDAPPGFSDTQFTGSPRLIDIAESLTPASNRILLFALEDVDLRRFMTGDPIELRRSVLAATPRAMQQEQLSLASFRAFVAASLGPQSDAAPARGDLARYLDARPEGQASPLGALRAEPEVASLLLGTRLPPAREDAPRRYLVSSRTLLLLRGKALELSVFSRYESGADLEWVRGATERWVEELRRLNSR
jgi:hypothetical protein